MVAGWKLNLSGDPEAETFITRELAKFDMRASTLKLVTESGAAAVLVMSTEKLDAHTASGV